MRTTKIIGEKFGMLTGCVQARIKGCNAAAIEYIAELKKARRK